MDRLIYTALTGLTARAKAQAVTANNLANASTTGFRRELSVAQGRYLDGPAATTRSQAGAPSASTPRSAGRVVATGLPLDVAMAGDAWLAVQADDGTQAFTRRGDLRLNPNGVLETGDGHPVLGRDGIPLTVPAGASLAVQPDGTLMVRSGDTQTIAGQIKLVAGTGLDKRSDGLFGAAGGREADPAARLTSGTLESSNVETAGGLAELVEQSRGFEVNARLLGVAKDLDERTARLMNVEG